MIKLSPNFTLEEAVFSSTAVRLGIENYCPDNLLENMETQAKGMELVRAALGFPVHVDSWYRCFELNLALHGAATSAHMRGLATDFICRAFGTPLEIARHLVAMGIKFDKLILEGSWLHISFDSQLRGIVLTAHFVPGQGVTYTDGLPPIDNLDREEDHENQS